MTKPALELSLLAALALATVACGEEATTPGTGGTTGSGGGTSTGGTSGGDGVTFPSSDTVAGIEALLDSGAYQAAPWVFDAAPRTGQQFQPHIPKVRVYWNPAAKTALEEGRAQSPGTGVAVVKEFYDDTDTKVGVSATWVSAAEPRSTDWFFYCSGPASVCGTSETVSETEPFFETGNNECQSCHGGTLLAELP